MLPSNRSTCSDEVLKGDNLPLNILHIDFAGGIVNNTDLGYFSRYFKDWLVDRLNDINCWGHGVLPGDVPSNTLAATQGAARTNPSRSYVDVPVSILELGDVALLLKNTSKSLIGSIGSTNIKYQFGVKPMVDDLFKLLHFQDQVSRRIKEMERLKSKRGLRRTISLGSWSATDSWMDTVQSFGTFINVLCTRTTKQEVRVHCRWIPEEYVVFPDTPDEMRRLARKAVLGMTVDLSTAWELMPWSWLIDWCTGIGTFLSANRNIIPARLAQVTVMRHTLTEISCPAFSDPSIGNLTMTPIRYKREQKTRDIGAVLPTAHFPFLSGKQMGILASLAVAGK